MSEPRMIPISFDVAVDADDVQALGEFVIEIRDDYLEREAEFVPEVCGVCGEPRGAYIPDACIGKLPGVRAACCGHGNPADAYVSIKMGEHNVVIHGQDAVDWMKEVHEATL